MNKKSRILFFLLISFFVSGYFLTDVPGTFGSDYKGIFYTPLLLVSFLPGIIAFMGGCIGFGFVEGSTDLLGCRIDLKIFQYFLVSIILSALITKAVFRNYNLNPKVIYIGIGLAVTLSLISFISNLF